MEEIASMDQDGEGVLSRDLLRGRQDHLFFDLKSNQSLDLFLLILDLRSIF
jgi:hypothetical protein